MTLGYRYRRTRPSTVLKAGFSALGFALLALALTLSAANAEEGEERVLPVEVVQIERLSSYSEERRFTGRAAVRRSTDLAFELGGKLADLRVDEGVAVRAGEILARLDTASLDARRAELSAQLAETKAALTLAEKTLARREELFRDGHISAQGLDEAQSNADALKAQRARIAASIDSVDVQLEQSILHAAFDGVVENRLVDEGAVVQPGTPVLRVLETNALEAKIGMPLKFAKAISAGAPFSLRAEDGTPLDGRLLSSTPGVRGETRTVIVTFALAADSPIADGQLVTVATRQERAGEGFWLPVEALTADIRGLWRVYKLAETERSGIYRIVFENVQIDYAEDARVFVTGTLEDGDRIVAGGVRRIVPGKLVRIAETVRIAAARALDLNRP